MKEVVNKTNRLLVCDLNSYDEDGRIKAIFLSPFESVSIEDTEANSKQLVVAEQKGLIEIKSSSKKSSKKTDDESISESSDAQESESSKKSDSKKKSNKEDK